MKEYESVVNSFLAKISGERPRISNIYLFGSRARGAARPDSDYDLLVVMPEKDRGVKDRLYGAAVDVFMESEADISLKVISQGDFDRMKKLSAPFIMNILKDGIKVG